MILSERRLRKPLLILLVAISIIVIAGIRASFIHHYGAYTERLAAVAAYKAGQVSAWLQERDEDAGFLQHGKLIRYYADARPAAAGFREALDDWCRKQGFTGVTLTDPHGTRIWGSDHSPQALHAAVAELAAAAGSDNAIHHIGPYVGVNGTWRFDFVVPLQLGDAAMIAVLHTEPMTWLSRKLQSWPVPGGSGDVDLIRRAGNLLVYLYRSHPRQGTVDAARPGADEPYTLNGQILRHRGAMPHVFEGPDGRGRYVIAAAADVPRTDWVLLARQDKIDLVASSLEDSVWIALAGLLSLAIVFGGFRLLRQQERLGLALEERRTQAAQLQSMSLLAAIAESTDDAVFAKDMHGRYIFFNQAASRFVGKPVSEVLGRDDRSIFPPDQAEMLIDSDRRVLQDGRTLVQEEQLDTADGERVFLAIKGPLRDKPGNVIGTFGMSRDITAEKNVTRALHEKDNLLNNMSKLAHVGGWDFDPATGQGSWTEETAHIHDVDPSAPTSAEYGLEFFHGEHRARLEKALNDAIESGTPYDLELQMVTANGVTKWVRTICSPLVYEGRVVRVRGAIQDITEQKRAEIALRESEAMLSIAQAVARLGSWQLDIGTGTLAWSRETYRIFGLPEGTALTLEVFLQVYTPTIANAC